MKRLISILLALALVFTMTASLAEGGERRINPKGSGQAASPKPDQTEEPAYASCRVITLEPIVGTDSSGETTLFGGGEVRLYEASGDREACATLSVPEYDVEIIATENTLYVKSDDIWGTWISLDIGGSNQLDAADTYAVMALLEVCQALAENNPIIANWMYGAALIRDEEGYHLNLNLNEIPQALMLLIRDACESAKLAELLEKLPLPEEEALSWDVIRRSLLDVYEEISDSMDDTETFRLEADAAEDFSKAQARLWVEENCLVVDMRAGSNPSGDPALILNGRLYEDYDSGRRKAQGGFDLSLAMADHRFDEDSDIRLLLNWLYWDDYDQQQLSADLKIWQYGASFAARAFADGQPSFFLDGRADWHIDEADEGYVTILLSGQDAYDFADGYEPSAIEAKLSWSTSLAPMPKLPKNAIQADWFFRIGVTPESERSDRT